MRTDRLPAWIAIVFGLLAFIHATLWGQIVPLWQIPDEAAHFEYVHLLTRLGRRPTLQDTDPDLQARMLRSMWENHYWEYLGFVRPEQPPKRVLPGGWTAGGAIPDTAVVGDAYIGAFSQLQNPTPVYYALLAPIQAAVLNRPIDDQLHALRWASRVIFALGVIFIVLAAGEVFNWRRWPVLAAGAFVVLHPMFNYIGSGVNNDNGVMMFASAALWQLARGWRRGYPWWRIALIAGLVVLAIQSKRTGVFLIAWVPFVLASWWLWRQAPELRRKALTAIVATGTGIAALAGILYFVPGSTPANWHSAAPWSAGWEAGDAAEGARAFRVQAAPGGTPWLRTGLRRPLGAGDGLPITVSAQHRGGRAALVLSDDTGNAVTTTLSPSQDWQPAYISVSLDSRATRLFISLQALDHNPALFDALRMALATEPAQPLGLPNPSAEDVLPVIGQIILSLAEPLGVRGQASRLIQDYRANITALGERLPTAIAFVQQSFWGKFGIFARAPNPTVDIGWVTLLALGFGAALALTLQAAVNRQPDPDTAALLAMGAVGLGLLLLQTFAPLLSFAAQAIWLPQGRYLFSGIGLIALIVGAPLVLTRVPLALFFVTSGMTILAVAMYISAQRFFTITS